LKFLILNFEFLNDFKFQNFKNILIDFVFFHVFGLFFVDILFDPEDDGQDDEQENGYGYQ